MGARSYTPWTPVEAEQRMRQVAARLLDIVDEHAALVGELGTAKADYHETYHLAHIASIDQHPARKVAEHESRAQAAALEPHRRMVMLEERDKAMRHEAHSLRQVLSSIQTNARTMAGVT